MKNIKNDILSDEQNNLYRILFKNTAFCVFNKIPRTTAALNQLVFLYHGVDYVFNSSHRL